MEVAPGIHRVGNNSIVNAYLVEEAGEVTIVDTGVPGLYRDLPKELASMGRSAADVRALLLTHGHSDHIGFAERLRTKRHVPVSVHENMEENGHDRFYGTAGVTVGRSRDSRALRPSTFPAEKEE